MARLTSQKTNSERYRLREEFADRELFSCSIDDKGTVGLSFQGDEEGDRDYRLLLTATDVDKIRNLINKPNPAISN